jgi:hypothetical protein
VKEYGGWKWMWRWGGSGGGGCVGVWRAMGGAAGVLSKFLVMRVHAASSNLIWRCKLVEGLRSDATVTSATKTAVVSRL